MSDLRKTREPLPLRAASRGEAPGRARLKGRKILLVGGGQKSFDPATDPIGNGRAIGRLFAREGAHVAVADINEQSAADTLQQVVDDEHGAGLAIQADVRDEHHIARMFDEAISGLGGIDGVVFNVGVPGPVGLDISVAHWDNVLAANLRGAFLVGRAALERLDEGGSIVLISSTAGYKAGSQLPAYDASKAALAAVMRQLMVSGAKKDIRVNIVVPGLVDTALGRAAAAARPNRGRGENLLFRRQATAWEIAYAALYFTSDESAFVTGQELAVDSGQTAV